MVTTMCRYAWHNYRDHFACFDCRKAFKHWQWEEVDEGTFHEGQKRQHVPREIVCPECSRAMVDMGLDFKAPPHEDVKTWEIMRALRAHGFRCQSCGCGAGLRLPRTLREVPDWIERHRVRTEGEKLAVEFAARNM